MKRKKTAIVKDLVNIIRQDELSYQEFIQLCKEARDITQLKAENKYQEVKPVPTIEDCRKFINVIDKQNPKDSLMIKMLVYLGIRSAELVNIKMSDIELSPGEEKVFLNRKAGRNKWAVIPEKIASLLRLYCSSLSNNLYLFESAYHKPYTTRALRMKIQKYREEAGLGDIIHAHNFRHLLLTLLAANGWSDSELQLVSGHDARSSLDRYIYKNPETIRTKINGAINNMGV
jgi:integrase